MNSLNLTSGWKLKPVREEEMEILIGIAIFISVICLVEGSYYAFSAGKSTEQKKVRKRLKKILHTDFRNEEVDILQKKLLSEVSWFNQFLMSMPRIHSLDLFLEQANTRYPLGFYLLLSALLFSCGFMTVSLFRFNFITSFVCAVLAGSLPFFFLYSMKKRRMKKFEKQLPDALDLIVRSLKAGHAFAGGIRMVADEFEDPLGPEFAKVTEEVNFGVGVPDALNNLIKRVECQDLGFFVMAVVIQRETGGNLAEVLDKISRLIRERFRFNDKVRALSAEGKLSAMILAGLPFLIAFYLSIVNPEYLGLLVTDPIGNAMSVGAVIMMILGILVLKKLVNIRV